jgi:hypothetical protein
VSKLPCGLNGALYFVQMDADGGMAKYENNTAGAKYGTGYCDAQVAPRLRTAPPLLSPPNACSPLTLSPKWRPPIWMARSARTT